MEFSAFVSKILLCFLWTLEYVKSDSCDFEDESNSFCGWQSKGWLATKYAYHLIRTGPRRAKVGEFYIRTELNETSGPAILHVQVSSQSCLHFWYHMYGDHIANLSVLSTNQGTDPLWTRSGNQGDMWRCGAASVPPSVSEVRFIGYKGSDAYDIIALDHIQLNSDSPCDDSGCNRTASQLPPSTSGTMPSSSSSTTVSTIEQTATPSWLSENLEIVIAVPCAVLAVCIVVVVVFVCYSRKKSKVPQNLSRLENQRNRPMSGSSDRYRNEIMGIPSSVYDEPEQYDEIPADMEDYITPVAEDRENADGGYIQPTDVGKSDDGAVHENGGISVDFQRQNVGFNSSAKRESVVDDDGYTTAKTINNVQNERY